MRYSINLCILSFALCLPAVTLGATLLRPSLRVTAEERYDDDFRLHEGNTWGGQIMSKLAAEAGANLKSPLLVVEGAYGADLRYLHGSREMKLDHRFWTTLRQDVSQRVRVQGDVRLWRVSDPTSLPRLGVAAHLVPVLYARAELSAQGLLTERLSLKPGYRFEGAHLYDIGRETGLMHAPFVESWYGLNRRSSVGAEYRFQYFQLSGDPVTATASRLGSSQAHGLFGLLSHRVSRLDTLTVRAGPVFYRRPGRPETDGVLPRVNLEWYRKTERMDVGLTLGHELVGASGFAAAMWADYASLAAGYQLSRPVRTFAAASYFRNGQAPNQNFDFNLSSSREVTAGYALGVGMDWALSRLVTLQGTLDRVSQVGITGDIPVAAVTRNIAAVRLSVKAF